jgi:isopropylmalate/homocitrate/citramalate synthase
MSVALPDPITIVDNTLREGEQTPGVAFSVEDKLAILEALCQAGIGFFDASFPEAFPQEAEFIARARERFPNLRLGATCRLGRQGLLEAERLGANELFVVVPASDIQLSLRLKMSRSELLCALPGAVGDMAHRIPLNVVLEDAFRADETFLFELLKAGCDLGASRFFLADTVGIMLPGRVGELVGAVRAFLPDAFGVGTHFHDDFGLALANTLAGIKAGALFPTAAVNGLGERAGNTDLARLAAAAALLLKRETGVALGQLRAASGLVMKLSGILVGQNSAVTGYNAFRHTSGIHTHGLLLDRKTYEGVDPAHFGARSELVLGKLSGRAHVRHLLEERGVTDDATAQKVLARVKRTANSARTRAAREELLRTFNAFNEMWLGMRDDELRKLLEEEENP